MVFSKHIAVKIELLCSVLSMFYQGSLQTTEECGSLYTGMVDVQNQWK